MIHDFWARYIVISAFATFILLFYCSIKNHIEYADKIGEESAVIGRTFNRKEELWSQKINKMVIYKIDVLNNP